MATLVETDTGVVCEDCLTFCVPGAQLQCETDGCHCACNQTNENSNDGGDR